MNKKLVMTLGAAALIGAIGIGSTFAYLTAETEEVTNTFTIGDIGLELAESEVERDEDGVYVDADGDEVWDASGNAYYDIVAGETVYKDPTATVKAGSVDCYLFITVAYTDQVEIEVDEALWTPVSYIAEDGDPVCYVTYVYNAIVEQRDEDQNFTLFDSVTFSDELEAGDEIDDIVIFAGAVQANGFDDVEDAYAVYEEQCTE